MPAAADSGGTVYDVDAVLRQLGTAGRYQIWTYLWVCLPWISNGWHLMAMSFFDNTPPHICELPDNHTFFGQNVTRGQCEVLVDAETIPCGQNGTYIAFDEDYGQNIVTEWNLVCDPQLNLLGKTAQSMYMFGYMAGAVLPPPLTDRFGRRPILLTLALATIPIGFATVLANSYTFYIVLRFAMGFLYSSYVLASWSLTNELFPADCRSFVPLGTFFGWLTGYVTIGVLAYFVRNWRTLELVISIPLLVHIAYYWIIRESLFWLNAKNRTQQFQAEVAYASKFNSTTVDLAKCQVIAEPDPDRHDHGVLESAKEICSSPILTLYVLVMCFFWCVDSLVYYGLSVFSTDLSTNRYMSFCISGLVAIPAYAAGMPLLKKIGRRASSMLFHAIAAVSLLTLACAEPSGLWQLVLYMTGKRHRRGGSFHVLVHVYRRDLSDHNQEIYHKQAPAFLFSALSWTVVLLLLLLPETLNAPLPNYPNDVAVSKALSCLKRNDKRAGAKRGNEIRQRPIHTKDTLLPPEDSGTNLI